MSIPDRNDEDPHFSDYKHSDREEAVEANA